MISALPPGGESGAEGKSGQSGPRGAGPGVPAKTAVPPRPAAHLIAVLAGMRHPVVAILLAIAFFTGISGKPLDGVLTLIVALSLAWDTGRRGRGDAPTLVTTPTAPAPAPAAEAPPRQRRPLLVGILVAGGAAYTGVVGSFDRYSWPATVGIVALGVVVVSLGWRGSPHRGVTDTSSANAPQPTHLPPPTHAAPPTPPPPTNAPPRRHPPPRTLAPPRTPASRRTHTPLPATGTGLWGGLFVSGCLWELAALLEQPNLATSSYAHPTVSTLTDPVLASSTGRWAVLAGWLALGWYLIKR